VLFRSLSGTWIGLVNVVQAMSISGGGRGATSAGLAEALATSYAAAFSIVLIALVALIRSHRPFLDRITAVLAIACLVVLLAAVLFSARIAPVMRHLTLAFVWAGIALNVAVITALRLFFVVRRHVLVRAIPFGVAITALAFASAAVLVYSEVHRYVYIAIHG